MATTLQEFVYIYKELQSCDTLEVPPVYLKAFLPPLPSFLIGRRRFLTDFLQSVDHDDVIARKIRPGVIHGLYLL